MTNTSYYLFKWNRLQIHFEVLCLFFLANFPCLTFIQGPTFILFDKFSRSYVYSMPSGLQKIMVYFMIEVFFINFSWKTGCFLPVCNDGIFWAPTFCFTISHPNFNVFFSSHLPHKLIAVKVWMWPRLLLGSEFMGKTFQAAQLTHERFLTIDHSCKIFSP